MRAYLRVCEGVVQGVSGQEVWVVVDEVQRHLDASHGSRAVEVATERLQQGEGERGARVRIVIGRIGLEEAIRLAMAAAGDSEQEQKN